MGLDMRKPVLSSGFAKNKYAEQPAHLYRPISSIVYIEGSQAIITRDQAGPEF